MKRLLFLLIFILLVGCSNDETQEQTQTDDETEQEENENETEEDSLILTNVGDTINDNGATLELLAIEEVNETIDLDPIKLTIDDIKIIRMSDFSGSDTEVYMEQFTEKETVDYIQVMYSMENTVDENVDFISPISHLVLDTGEQINVNHNDFMLHPDNLDTFYGTVTKEAGISAIIDNSSVDDINTVKIITGFVMNEDGEILSEEKEITYEIN